MARMPGARWRPLADNWATQPRLTRYDLLLLHTAVGSFDGTYNYFRSSSGYTGAESHFMTSGAGDIDQYQDTAHQAEANGAANSRAISVENADMGPQFAPWNTGDGNAVPPFTPQQIEANARIAAWAHQQHGIPLELVPDSRPGRRGIGYHRLGVPGYATAGGELWSSARGKSCPGPKRIAQIPQIIARARQLVAPPTTVAAANPAPPTPYLTGDDDVILACELTPGQTTYGVLSGGVLTGLGTDGGITDAAKAGRLFVLWVNRGDWTEIDRKSRLMLGEPAA